MHKTLAFITTAIVACITIVSITAAMITWDTWGQTKTSMAVAQTAVDCPANIDRKCLDIDVYEALNIMPREDRPLTDPRLGAYYGGTSSPPNPLEIKQGESVTFFIGPQYFLPASYEEGGTKYVPHVGAGSMWPLKYTNSTEPVFTNNKLTFNSGDSSNSQQVIKEFGHAGVKDQPPSPTSAQYLIASGPVTYNNVGEFVATARVQMIRHFYTGCSPADWGFVPTKEDLCPSGQPAVGHSNYEQDKLIDITVSRLIKVVP
ncbi:MAG: hypothetical protein ACHBN1_06750 [Heteroscytonema crispum UTEX LB 1556]